MKNTLKQPCTAALENQPNHCSVERMPLPEKMKLRIMLKRAALTERQMDKIETWTADDPDSLDASIHFLNKLDDPRYKGTSKAISPTMTMKRQIRPQTVLVVLRGIRRRAMEAMVKLTGTASGRTMSFMI